DRAPARDLLAAERYDGVPQASAANELDARFERADDENVANQKVDDPLEPGGGSHEGVRVSDHSRHAGELVFELSPLTPRERVERKESGAPGLRAVQEFDAPFGILRGRRHDVGEARAECDVERARVSLVGGDEIRNDALDTAQVAPLQRFDDRARPGDVSLQRV